MANKTIKITLFQNAMWGGTTANDTDLVVNHNGSDTIIQSDIDTSDVKTGDVVKQKVMDLDLTKDTMFSLKTYLTAPTGVGYGSEYQITIAGSSSGTHAISGRFNEYSDTSSGETSFEEAIPAPQTTFMINGVVKKVVNPSDWGWNSLGSYDTSWNGTDTLQIAYNVDQQNTVDSTVNMGMNVRIEIIS